MTKPFIQTLSRLAADLASTLDHWPVIGRVIAGDATRSEYLGFLVGTYQYVSWSGPLLAASAAGARRSGRYEALAQLLAEKAEEEGQHDRWVLQDAERCGATLNQVRGAPTNSAVTAYISWTTALADAGSPAYLGAAYVLEAVSMLRAGEAARNLRSRGTIPGIEHAVTFLEGHAEADVNHVRSLEEALEEVEDARDQAELLASGAVLATLYPRFFVAFG